MTTTPWGDTATLRDRQLRSSRGVSASEVAQNSRERLFAAMVEIVDEKGFEATTVADLLTQSGVSRTTFYQHFDDKRDCFVAAAEAIIEATTRIAAKRLGASGTGEAKARAMLESFVELVVSQPAASRLCFVEAYAAGPEALEAVQRGVDRFVELLVEADQAGQQRGVPDEIRRAIVGAFYLIVNNRLYRRQESELTSLMPQLWEWAFSYRPPPQPLVLSRSPTNHAPAEAQARGSSAVADPAERIIRGFAAAVAEHGYPGTTIAEIADRASVSQSTFYSTFKGRKEVLLSAIDSAGARMFAAMLPAARRGEDWPDSMRLALGALASFGAMEPDLLSLLAVHVYAAGSAALVRREEVTEGLLTLFAPAYELAPDAAPIAAEGAVNAVYALIYNQIVTAGPQRLVEVIPTTIYVSLLPFIGVEAAFERASAWGSGRGR